MTHEDILKIIEADDSSRDRYEPSQEIIKTDPMAALPPTKERT